MKTIKDALYNRNHTLNRVQERYNIEMSREDYEMALILIESHARIGDDFTIQKLPSRDDDRDVYRVWLDFEGGGSAPIIFVYNPETKRIETALPPED